MSTPQVNSENRSMYAEWFLEMMDNILSHKEFFLRGFEIEMRSIICDQFPDRAAMREYKRDAIDFEEIIDSESFDVAAARYAELDVVCQTAFGNIYLTCCEREDGEPNE